MSQSPPQPSPRTPLELLMEQLLLGRLDDLSAPQVAAFLRGWSSLLDLLRRPDLTLPDASEEVLEALADIVARIERTQAAVLAGSEN